MMQTKAIVFAAPGQVTLAEIQLPEPTADELVVRCTCTGVSVGTERWALTGRRPEMSFPHVPGYLGVGVVEKAGAARGDFKIGQRVCFFHSRLPEPYGVNSWMGAHVSRAVVPPAPTDGSAPYVCAIPDGVDDASAAMAGLVSVGVQGADRVRITCKQTVLVLGLGMIGQGSAQLFRARGARVIVADVIDDRVKRARAAGIDEAVVLTPGEMAPQLAGVLPRGGADIVVDTSSVQSVLDQLWTLVRVDGQVVLQGYYPQPLALPLDNLVTRSPTLHMPNSNTREGHEYALRLIQTGQINMKPLITHRLPAAEAPAAYRMLLDRPNDCLGIVFNWE